MKKINKYFEGFPFKELTTEDIMNMDNITWRGLFDNPNPILDIADMSEEDWLLMRQGIIEGEKLIDVTIGGSDIGAIAGLSTFKTPLDVFFEKTGLAVEEEISQGQSDIFFKGHTLEPATIAAANVHISGKLRDNKTGAIEDYDEVIDRTLGRYTDMSKNRIATKAYKDELNHRAIVTSEEFAFLKREYGEITIQEDTNFYQNPTFPFMVSNTDSAIVDAAGNKIGVYEGKTANRRGHDWNNYYSKDQVPPAYLAQAAWYMANTNREFTILAVRYGEEVRDVKIFVFFRDIDFEKALVAAGLSFIKNHLETGVLPSIEGVSTAPKRMVENVAKHNAARLTYLTEAEALQELLDKEFSEISNTAGQKFAQDLLEFLNKEEPSEKEILDFVVKNYEEDNQLEDRKQELLDKIAAAESQVEINAIISREQRKSDVKALALDFAETHKRVKERSAEYLGKVHLLDEVHKRNEVDMKFVASELSKLKALQLELRDLKAHSELAQEISLLEEEQDDLTALLNVATQTEISKSIGKAQHSENPLKAIVSHGLEVSEGFNTIKAYSGDQDIMALTERLNDVTSQLNAKVAEFDGLRKPLEEEIDRISASIFSQLIFESATLEVALSDGSQATIEIADNVSGKTFDSAAFRKDFPALYELYRTRNIKRDIKFKLD